MKRAPAAFALLLSACVAPAAPRGVIVLGIDGMDPTLLRRFLDEGRLPNLAALAREGGFEALATSNPPQSPVAWSDFITGHGSEHHGIYDFLHRDPATRTPELSMSKVQPASVELFGEQITLPVDEVVNQRRGDPFWKALAEAGIPVEIVQIPAEYPPGGYGDARVLSGMGTPDLLGTPGLFQLFTTGDRPALDPAGGRIHPLVADDGVLRGELDGPDDPSMDGKAIARVPIELFVSHRHGAAVLRLDGHERLLRPGDWTDWLAVDFPLIGLGAVRGMVRASLRSLSPRVELYISPVNLDPHDPAQPIAVPDGYAGALAEAAGRYYTQGMPNDTKALLAGVFDRDAFLAQSEIVLAERERMLEAALTRFGGGLLFFYVPSVDLVSHMFYRTLDGDAPADRAYSAVIPDVYERVDAMVGRARQALRSGDVLVVMSDHGFGPYDRRAHVNSYLAASGFLVLQGGARVSGPLFAGVDWSRSRAYALGLNSLFLNLAGREAGGVVDGASKDRVLGDVERALRDWRDEDGTAVVSAVMRPAAFADGDRVPDLLIGFARGYRASDASALGEIGPRAVDRNDTAWTGDHCVDPALVPGVLLANVPVRPGGALTDLAATLRGVLLGGSDGGALLSVEAR